MISSSCRRKVAGDLAAEMVCCRGLIEIARSAFGVGDHIRCWRCVSVFVGASGERDSGVKTIRTVIGTRGDGGRNLGQPDCVGR